MAQLDLDQPPNEELTLVWDMELEAASWASNDQDIVTAARHGRPVRLIRVGPRLQEVLASVDRLLQDRGKDGPE